MSTLIAIPCLKVGGTEIQTLRLVEALVNIGHHCVTVCYFEYEFQMVQLYKQAGSRVVCLSAYGTRPTSQREIYSFLKEGLARVVKEYRPKVAMVQYMAPGAMPIIILKRLGIKNIIAMLHTDADIYKSLRLVRFLQRHTTQLFTCVTETAERNFFGSSHIIDSQSKTKKHDHGTLPNCLPQNYEFYDSRSKSQETQPTYKHSPFTIGIVSRLESIKGVDFVIPAFAKVLEVIPDSKLLIVGDGGMKGTMIAQQKEMQIPNDKIEWVGRVEYHQLFAYYRRMNVVWVPSRSEGFGLSAIEAMGQGCPIVASDVGGLKEIVHDGKDGLHFEAQNSNDLANKTLQLINKPDILQSMSINAIATAKQYSFDSYKQRVQFLLQSFSPSA